MKQFLGLCAAVFLFCLDAQATGLPGPAGEPVLAVTGNTAKVNAAGGVLFDMEMLEALPQIERTIETPWTNEATAFSGPRLSSVLEAAGATGRVLIVKALNDYSAEVPIEDALTLDTILATRMNGKLMSVREKGPLFLIYPFDTHPELFNEKYFSRSVWQIREVEVIE